MTNKTYNFLVSGFIIFGIYHLPGCDSVNNGNTTTTSMEQVTSTSTDICGDCKVSSNEECDVCSYKSQAGLTWCTDQKWPKGGDYGPCTIAWKDIPQLDCTIGWINKECGEEEANLICKLWTKIDTAKAISGGWKILDTPLPTKSLITQTEIANKNGVKLTLYPKSKYEGEVWTYEMNPYTDQNFAVMFVEECIPQ